MVKKASIASEEMARRAWLAALMARRAPDVVLVEEELLEVVPLAVLSEVFVVLTAALSVPPPVAKTRRSLMAQ
jgi:hypothetical protein